MSRHEQETHLPNWLWFFLILPIGLIALLLYRRREQIIPLFRRLAEQRNLNKPRYSEPDSIPLEIHPEAAPYQETGEGDRGATLGDIRDEDIAMEAMASEWGTAGTEAAAIVGGASAAQEAGSTEEKTEQPTTAEPDDLKAIEGIGPSIAGILRAQGITSFRQLADTPIEQLKEILNNAHLGHLADPGTWPEQARLAASGEWDDLIALQRTLRAGRRMNQE
jgi:predicted flap endonuclease-1-like 5' DNA nuclease